MSEAHKPFITLGKHLKYVREQSHRSLAEVSGAVEIDEHSLARIESGEERPAEDVLLLLISYFGMHDREAVQLWELADYEGEVPEQIKTDADLVNGKVVMLLGIDGRAIYTDAVDIQNTASGVTLNFSQGATGKSDRMTVSRVGMSLEQAENLSRQLQRALLHARYQASPKLLPPGRPTNNNS